MLSNTWNEWKNKAAAKVAQFKNATFRDCTMAVCALIAAADGEIEAQEKSKVAAFIQRTEALQVFPAAELKNIFLNYCDKAADEFSRIDLLSVVRKMKTNADMADTAMRVALIIANADGEFEASEKKVVRELANTLGLDPEKYLE